MIAVLRQVSNPGDCEGARSADMRIHRIASPLMLDLGYSSKLNGEWDFLRSYVTRGAAARKSFFTLTGTISDTARRSTSIPSCAIRLNSGPPPGLCSASGFLRDGSIA